MSSFHTILDTNIVEMPLNQFDVGASMQVTRFVVFVSPAAELCM